MSLCYAPFRHATAMFLRDQRKLSSRYFGTASYDEMHVAVFTHTTSILNTLQLLSGCAQSLQV